TIELGFAHFEIADGQRYGIIDVPGHEKFIPNMLAGAHGLDVVMMVVAADDGAKPQTLEHFEILHLLKVPRALFVITKIDMVKAGRIDEVREEIQILIDGSHLEGSRIIPASSKTGEGLDDVRKEISRLVSEEIPRIEHPYFRFPIDRVFTITGFGTVVTGTIISGSVNIEDEIILSPIGKKLRIRNIEVHECDVKSASAGQRTAINLPKIEKVEIERGMELISPALNSQMHSKYYAEIEMLNHKACRFKNFKRVRLYKGASESIVTLVNLTENYFSPKGKYIVDIGFRQPALITSHDRFIIRDETNRYTLGGGEFILPSTIKRAKLPTEFLDRLVLFTKSDLNSQIKSALVFDKKIAVPINELVAKFNRHSKDIESALNTSDDDILRLKWKTNCVGLRKKLEEKKTLILNTVVEYHQDNPEKLGISKQELRDSLKREFSDDEEIENVWELLRENGTVIDEGEYIKRTGFKVEFKGADAENQRRIIDLYSDFTSNPPKRDRLPELLGIDKDTAFRLLQGLVKSKELLMLKSDFYVGRKAFDKVEEQTKEYLLKNGSISIIDFKNLIGTNRNLSVMMLELMDSRGVTLRQENSRILRRREV
ncbi:selenocysteine-specific translation elongation factor, partial [bacterium]|nr:selenocysteine-specific translation elongation factor [bacterium]MBU1024537.1 selenocysteine-specific translation elongation factor [bacterium]